jgi:hypothetical protein
MRKSITAVLAALLLLAVTAAGASANISLSGGTASIAIEPSFSNKLAAKKVTPSLVSPATGDLDLRCDRVERCDADELVSGKRSLLL